MSRWSDVQNGRVDLIADDRNAETGRGWELYRVLIEAAEIDRAFLVRCTAKTGRVRMELFEDLKSAVNRCVEWMG